MNAVAMATIRPYKGAYREWVTLIACNTTKKVGDQHLDILKLASFLTSHSNQNNQQANGDQHIDLLKLASFLTSHSKPDYICRF